MLKNVLSITSIVTSFASKLLFYTDFQCKHNTNFLKNLTNFFYIIIKTNLTVTLTFYLRNKK